MSRPLQRVGRGAIVLRGATCRCPNCGHFALHRSWFRLRERCAACDLDLAMEEGFYSGTTSIGYVLILLVVLGPVVAGVITGRLGELQAILLGAGGTVLVTLAVYPVLLSWVLMSYYLWFPGQLPANGGRREIPPGQGR